MKLTVCKDSQEVSRLGAESIAQAVAAQPGMAIGLPTGRTMIPLYDELASRYERGQLDLSRVRGFNLDELLLPQAHSSSFKHFMQTHAYGRTGLDSTRCEIPNAAGNSIAECERYDQVIGAAGGFDLAILGIGADGHIAYNLPGPVHESTHIVEVPIAVADALKISRDQRPLRAITIGLGPLLTSRSLLLLATGESKAAAIGALIRGRLDSNWPCSLLQEHPGLEVLIDEAAAREVS